MYASASSGTRRKRGNKADQKSARRDESGERLLGRQSARFGERPPEQSPRTEHQDHRHDDELGDQRELGVAQPDAERLHLGDEQRGEECPGDGSQAAEYHDHESVGDDREIDFQVRRLARDRHRASEPGKRGAQREHAGEEQALVHAQSARHLAILGRRAHQDAEAGPREQQVEKHEHRRAERDQEEVVLRELPAGDGDGAAQPRRARTEHVFRPPCPERQVLDHEHQGEGREQLKQLGRAVEPSQQSTSTSTPSSATPRAASGTLAQKPTFAESHTARYMPSM